MRGRRWCVKRRIKAAPTPQAAGLSCGDRGRTIACCGTEPLDGFWHEAENLRLLRS
jgi:hypothetical protein